MTERDRLLHRIADLESVEQGLHSNIAAFEKSITAAQRGHPTGQSIRELQSSIAGAQREIVRVRNQIRGIQAELKSLR